MQEFLFDDDCWSRLKTVFGEALLYDVRVLFIEKFGANLRPHIAHGILPQSASASHYGIYMLYAWWLALRLCFDSLPLQAALSASINKISDTVTEVAVTPQKE